MTLLRDGKAVTDARPVVTDNGDGTYTISYRDLPDEGTYTVKESTVPEGYRIKGKDTAEDGGTITNELPPGGDNPPEDDDNPPPEKDKKPDTGDPAEPQIMALLMLLSLGAMLASRRKEQ